LARSGLADDAEGLTALDAQAHPVDGVDVLLLLEVRRRPDREVLDEVVHLKQDIAVWRAHVLLTLPQGQRMSQRRPTGPCPPARPPAACAAVPRARSRDAAASRPRCGRALRPPRPAGGPRCGSGPSRTGSAART